LDKPPRSKRIGFYAIFWLLIGIGVLSAMGWSYLSAAHPKEKYTGWDQDRAPDQIGVPSGSITVSTDFEGAQPLEVREISPTHFWIMIGEHDPSTWFAFEVTGAAGKTVSFDIMISEKPENWATVNPVLCYTDSYELGNPDTFECRSLQADQPMVRFPNRAKAPPTNGVQKWQFIEKSSLSDDGLHFTQHFEQSPAIVAMTYPLTPKLNSRFIDDAARSPLAKIITVGTSARNRPLQIVQIANALPAASDHRPMMAVVARDIGCDQEPGWVAWGMIHFLLSDDPAAQEARSRCIFAFMPCVDPDSAAVGGRDLQMIDILQDGNKRPEPRRYAEYFNKQRDAGHRPVLALTLRTVIDITLPVQVTVGEAERGYQHEKLSPILSPILKAKGISFDDRYSNYFGSTYYDFPAWFIRHFQAESLEFATNGQCSAGHMTLGQLQDVGQCLVRTVNEYLKPKPQGDAGAGQ
jgi:hypothetical protein